MMRSLSYVGGCVLSLALCAASLAQDQAETSDEPLFGEYSVAPVAYESLQPAEGMESMGMGGMTAPPPATRSPSVRRAGPTGSRQANIRLASVPHMFGDVGMSMGQLFSADPVGNGTTNRAAIDIPAAGGSRRVKIGENNIALPSDRVYVMYNHFHNVFQVSEAAPFGPPRQRQTHLDRYTVGFEKMFFDDLWSVEVRQAFNSSFDYAGTNIGVDGGNLGNTAIILKNLLYTDDSTAIGGGIAFDLPTGSDVAVQLNGLPLDFENDSFHLLPWLGFASGGEIFYVTGFAQLDFAANGNEVRDTQAGNRVVGIFNEQNLLYLDLAVGSYLYQNPDAERLTSIALQGELHYTTTLQDTDVLDAQNVATPFVLANPYNRQDIVNGTVALQFQIGWLSTFRVAAVAPLSQAIDERLFDAELQFQYNRRF